MFLTIQPATPKDLKSIITLLNQAHLPLDGFPDDIDMALVIRDKVDIIGCAALELYPPFALLRSIAVVDKWRGNGLGLALTQAALDEARRNGITHVYLLTVTAFDFFLRFGFRAIARASVPDQVRDSVEFTTACPESAQAMVFDFGDS